MSTTPQKTYGRIVGPSANLLSELHRLGIWGNVTLTLSSESDGKKLETAIAGSTGVNINFVPFDPTIGQVQRSTLIGGITFAWPTFLLPTTE